MSTFALGTILVHPTTASAYVVAAGPAPPERIRLQCPDAPGGLAFGKVCADRTGPYVVLDGTRGTRCNRLRAPNLPGWATRALQEAAAPAKSVPAAAPRFTAPTPTVAPRFTALTTQEWPGGSSLIGLGEDGRAYRYVHSDKAWHLVPTTLGP